MKSPTNLGLPLLMLGALWGAVSIVLQCYQIINSKRDQILLLIECRKAFAGELAAAPQKFLDHCAVCCCGNGLAPVHIYFSNLLSLQLGLLLFLAIVSVGVLSIPKYLGSEDESLVRSARRISRFTASLPIFAFLAFLTGAFFDAHTILFKHGDWIWPE